jgi:two-component system OmpR family response regulator
MDSSVHNKQESILAGKGICLDPANQSVSINGRCICLTPREYSLLKIFVFNLNKILTREYLSENAWNSRTSPFTNHVDVYISFLRKKLAAVSDAPLIQTVRGAGYIMRVKE